MSYEVLQQWETPEIALWNNSSVTIVDITILYFIPIAAVDVLFLMIVFSCIKNYSNQKSATWYLAISTKAIP